jgi:hypothetical protein
MDRCVFIRLATAAVLSLGWQAAVWSQTPPPASMIYGPPGVTHVADGSVPGGTVFFSDPAAAAISHESALPRDFLGRPKKWHGGPIAGAAFVWMRSDFEARTAFFVQDETEPIATRTSAPFDFGHHGAPRVWAGWQDEWGFGVRVTGFWFSDSSAAQAVAQADDVFFQALFVPEVPLMEVGGTAGDNITAVSSFEFYTLDAELIQELCFDNWHLMFGGGYRHGAVSQQYGAVGTAFGAEERLDVGRRFDGDGATAFGEVRLPVLGAKDRRFLGAASLSLFSHGRGSVLFGRSKWSTLRVEPGPFVQTARAAETDRIAIGELRIGAQVDFRPRHGKLLFAAVAWESQWIQGLGNVTTLTAEQDLVLSGFSVSGGVEW